MRSLVTTAALALATLLASLGVGLLETGGILMPPRVGLVFELAVAAVVLSGWLLHGAGRERSRVPGAPALRVVVLAAVGVAAVGLAEHYFVAPSRLPGVDEAVNHSTAAAALVGALLISPILEELLFRGWLLTRLRRVHSPATSAVVSAALFALAHQDPSRAAAQFLLGVALAALVIATGRLELAMAAHALHTLATSAEVGANALGAPERLGLAYPVVCLLVSVLAAIEYRRVLATTRWGAPSYALDQPSGRWGGGTAAPRRRERP